MLAPHAAAERRRGAVVVLTFLHTWRLPPHVAARMVAALRPVAFEFEAPLPEATTCDANSSCPVQQYAFTSLWQSRLAVLRLVRWHETRTLRRRFDAVLLARLDLCPCQAARIDAARAFRLPAAVPNPNPNPHPHPHPHPNPNPIPIPNPNPRCTCASACTAGRRELPSRCPRATARAPPPLQMRPRPMVGPLAARAVRARTTDWCSAEAARCSRWRRRSPTVARRWRTIARRSATRTRCSRRRRCRACRGASCRWRSRGRSADVHGSTHGSARLLNESEYMPFSVGLIRDSWPLVSCNTPRLTAEPRLCYDTFCACERTGFLRVARREHRRLDLRPQPGTPCRDVGRQGNAVLQGG